jgi:hypothetical protein
MAIGTLFSRRGAVLILAVMESPTAKQRPGPGCVAGCTQDVPEERILLYVVGESTVRDWGMVPKRNEAAVVLPISLIDAIPEESSPMAKA